MMSLVNSHTVEIMITLEPSDKRDMLVQFHREPVFLNFKLRSRRRH